MTYTTLQAALDVDLQGIVTHRQAHNWIDRGLLTARLAHRSPRGNYDTDENGEPRWASLGEHTGDPGSGFVFVLDADEIATLALAGRMVRAGVSVSAATCAAIDIVQNGRPIAELGHGIAIIDTRGEFKR